MTEALRYQSVITTDAETNSPITLHCYQFKTHNYQTDYALYPIYGNPPLAGTTEENFIKNYGDVTYATREIEETLVTAQYLVNDDYYVSISAQRASQEVTAFLETYEGSEIQVRTQYLENELDAVWIDIPHTSPGQSIPYLRLNRTGNNFEYSITSRERNPRTLVEPTHLQSGEPILIDDKTSAKITYNEETEEMIIEIDDSTNQTIFHLPTDLPYETYLNLTNPLTQNWANLICLPQFSAQ